MKNGDIRVALRADASRSIGLGHVKRCLALAAALRAIGADARLVTRDLGVDTLEMTHTAGIERVSLPGLVSDRITDVDHVPHAAWAGVGWQVDADQCVKALAYWQPDWVVVDHYAFDARWHGYVSKELNARLAAIDDLADRDLSVELLVDPNLCDDHREKYAGHLPEGAALLGGPRFALLGPAYAGAAPLVVREVVRSIGIFMGGVDAGNLSCLALRACRKSGSFSGPVEIAITRAFPHAQALETLAEQWTETSLVSDLPDLAGFFARHDLQIGAGGGAAWERCCIGAPTLALAAAANQDAVLPALAKSGAIVLIEGVAFPSEDVIGRAIQSLIGDPARRQELGARSRALVDGLGARRVALRLGASSLSIRAATRGDSEMMYVWRNHETTRNMSLHREEIPWQLHQAWLNDSLKAEGRHVLVGMVGQTAIGIIRFDVRSEYQAEVSLYLDPALLGLGLGRSMLLVGEEYMLVHRPEIREFMATVLEHNTGSTRMFSSCGYHLRQGVWRKNTSSRHVKEVNRT